MAVQLAFPTGFSKSPSQSEATVATGATNILGGDGDGWWLVCKF